MLALKKPLKFRPSGPFSLLCIWKICLLLCLSLTQTHLYLLIPTVNFKLFLGAILISYTRCTFQIYLYSVESSCNDFIIQPSWMNFRILATTHLSIFNPAKRWKIFHTYLLANYPLQYYVFVLTLLTQHFFHLHQMKHFIYKGEIYCIVLSLKFKSWDILI